MLALCVLAPMFLSPKAELSFRFGRSVEIISVLNHVRAIVSGRFTCVSMRL